MSTPSSSVPSINWLPSGPVVPDESDILDGVMADANAAFGGNMNKMNLSTPQGQLAQSTTAIIGAKNDDILEVVNGVDPDKSDGRFQDGIGRIYFIDRNPAQPTVVTATCVGLAGTPIPVGAKAKASDGNIYLCTQAGTIPVGGSIDLTFACSITGPIACAAGQLNKIYQAIPGWDTINNASDGVIGNVVESRADFENRRRQSVALNSKGSVPSVRGAVLDVANVLDAYVVDNPLGTAQTIGGVLIAANSLYVCVAGGAAQDIANAIWTKKSPGCNYTGGTPVTVYDTDGYTAPYPQYTVKFDVAAGLPILFAVQIANVSGLPSDIVTQVQNAIISAFTGADGGQRARIGRTIYASRYYAGIEAINPNVELISVQIGTTTANQNLVGVNINQIPTISANNIAVTLV
ncbi:baseplate J/gp47 family protein [Paraburkholderia caribensis]|uniref:baseplate J/gp47 family protein n=1 Tax=Paraburkholderia caribensis TaxID=75105 RepID=UPI001D08E563|nr:baseplate J/gp47 family protein [Paraburkholderia caribensis]